MPNRKKEGAALILSSLLTLYKKEFGKAFDLGINLGELNFLIDKSWRQDMSPSFYFKASDDYFVLWIDFEKKEQREESNERYLIQRAKNEGNEDEPEIYATNDILFSGEVPEDIKTFLLNFISCS